MRDQLRKYGTQVSAAAMVVMLVVTFGIPVPSMQGGDLHVDRKQAVGEAEGLAVTTAVGLFAAGAAAVDAYDHYIADRDPSAMSDSELKVAIAQDAYSAQQTQENYITDSENALTLSENNAKREAYQTYVNERAAGASHSEAVTAAKTRVDDFYSKQQTQLIKKYETQVVEGGGIVQMETQWDELSGNGEDVYDPGSTNEGDTRVVLYQVDQDANAYDDVAEVSANYSAWGDNGHGYGSEIVNDNGHIATNHTLVNGSDVTYRTVAGAGGSGATAVELEMDYDADSHRYAYVDVYDPDTGSMVRAIEFTKYQQMMSDIESQHSSVQSTLGTASSGYLTDVNNYQQNNNVTWAELAIDEPDVDAENTTVTQKEYYTRVLGQNLDSPETGTVMTIETPDGNNGTTTINGTVYTSYAPPTDPDNDSEGEWTTGHAYNASQGVTYVLDTDGNLHHVDGDMTITSITTPSGDSVETTAHEDVTLDTSNTTDLKNAIDRLNNRIDEIEAQNNDGGGGITIPIGDSGLGIGLIAGAAILLILAIRP